MKHTFLLVFLMMNIHVFAYGMEEPTSPKSAVDLPSPVGQTYKKGDVVKTLPVVVVQGRQKSCLKSSLQRTPAQEVTHKYHAGVYSTHDYNVVDPSTVGGYRSPSSFYYSRAVPQRTTNRVTFAPGVKDVEEDAISLCVIA